MARSLRAVGLLVLLLGSTRAASAQLLVASDGRIVYGHHHLNVTDIQASKKFLVDTLGGTDIKLGTNPTLNVDVVKFPNVFIMLRQRKPTGGSKGTTVDHIGFSVANLRAMVDQIKAHGYLMVTREETPASVKVTNDIAQPSPTTFIAFAMGPDDLKVELVENKQQTVPIQLHHVHFFGQQNMDMREWYARTFGAKVRAEGNVVAADLPGVALIFSSSPGPVVGTTGRVIEHLGFEVKDLEAFCKNLDASGVTFTSGYHKGAGAQALSSAVITDPWGTSIELTEGLSKIE